MPIRTKRLKRQKDTVEEYNNNLILDAEDEKLAKRAELNYFYDRAGSASVKKKLQIHDIPKAEGSYISKTEKAVVQKVLSGHLRKPKTYDSFKEESILRDIWMQNEPEPCSAANESSLKRIGKNLKAGIKLPIPGQSYNPSQKDHLDAVKQVS